MTYNMMISHLIIIIKYLDMLRRVLIANKVCFSSGLSPVSLFQQRKLHYQSTSVILKDPNFLQLQQKSGAQPVSAYCGYDPTSDSLHLGNLISIIMMVRMHRQLGIRPIFLLGGATGLIGDPSGKKEQRTLLAQQIVHNNLKSIKNEILNVYSRLDRQIDTRSSEYGVALSELKHEPIFVNNNQFYESMNVLHYLRDVGKVLRMGPMLSKEIVANRLKSQNGLSYTEFSYSILQAYDFHVLSKRYGCCLQIGGSDQWGNITNGCDLVKKFSQGQAEVFGITMPLLLSKTGQKFGKSQGNALYLSSQKTPLSLVYDYLLSTSDEDIEKLLHIFTFYSPQKIQQIMSSHGAAPEKRSAQKILAETVTSYLGSYTNVKEELMKITEQALTDKTAEQLHSYFKQLPSQSKITIPLSDLSENLPDLLCKYGITATKKEARREVEAEGIYINNSKIPKNYTQEPLSVIKEKHVLIGGFLLVRRGKKKCYLIRFQ